MRLAYFLVIQRNGLPLFAQSFDFEDDEACQSFNGLLQSRIEGGDAVLSGYFTAVKMIMSDVVREELNLVNLGFKNFEIYGVVEQGIFFIGIFDTDENDVERKSNHLLNDIASSFLGKYPNEMLEDPIVKHHLFKDFTEDIIRITGNTMMPANCRNCLTKCTTENMNCATHDFYFDRVKFDKDLITLK